MKFRIDKDNIRLMGTGVGLILIGILLIIFLSNSTIFFVVGPLLVIVGIMTIVMATYVSAKVKDDLIEDERSVRINEKAGYHAFWVLLSIMSFVQLIDIIWKLDFEIWVVLSSFFAVGIWSWIIFRWYYNKKGEEM